MKSDVAYASFGDSISENALSKKVLATYAKMAKGDTVAVKI
jgi:hypothetical protein